MIKYTLHAHHLSMEDVSTIAEVLGGFKVSITPENEGQDGRIKMRIAAKSETAGRGRGGPRHMLPNRVPSREILLDKMKEKGQITTTEAEKLFMSLGLVATGASARLAELEKSGKIRRDNEKYVLVKS